METREILLKAEKGRLSWERIDGDRPGTSRSEERDEACSGISEPLAQRLYVRIAAEKDCRRHRQRDAGQFIDRRGLIRWARASEERVTGLRRQVESRGQRTHGLDMRPPAFPALQRAHGMDREPRNGRELLLGESRRLAERLELRAK